MEITGAMVLLRKSLQGLRSGLSSDDDDDGFMSAASYDVHSDGATV